MSRSDVRCLSLLAVGLLVAAVGCGEQGAPRVTYAVPPVIQETSRSPASVGPGEPMRLGVTVSASSGESLSFAWSTTVGAVSGSVDAAGRSEVSWMSLSCLAPDVTPTVTVTITNGVGLSVSHTFPITWTGPVCTRAPCLFSLEDGRVVELTADCTTDSTLLIPDDYTFDGNGHTLTAVDPPGGTFTGAVLRNRGTKARVRDVIVTASGLRDDCREGAERLRGILLEGASGEVVDSEVRDLQKGVASGCQEGFGIEVRNDDAGRGPFQVDVLRNRVSGYQKTGLLAVGAVQVTLSGNTVDGGGPVGHIARNGIQVGFGARGRVTGNTLSGNAYTGPATGTFGGGLVVVGGSYYGPDSPLVTDLVVEGNTFTDNDVGVSLSQLEAGFVSPSVPTRIRVAGNTLSNGSASNPYFQAAIDDYGTANILTSNVISGAGYDPATEPGRTFSVYGSADPARKLVFLTPARDVAVGACSGKLTVQSQDAQGNLVPSSGTFTLSATGPAASGLTFFADPGCTGGALATVSLSNAQAESNFYFKATTPGAVTVSVEGAGLSPASQAHAAR